MDEQAAFLWRTENSLWREKMEIVRFGNPVHRTYLLHNDDLEILQEYNAEIRGLYNYYKIADNASVLGNFGYIMEYSMYKTFAAKYKTHIGVIKGKYRIGKDFGVRYQTKSGPKVMLFYNEGFRHVAEAATREFWHWA